LEVGNVASFAPSSTNFRESSVVEFMKVEDTGLLEVVAVMYVHVGFVPWGGGRSQKVGF
jgi:hypothetical protein